MDVPRPMLTVFRLWWPLLLAVLAIQLANGLQATVVGLRVAGGGFSAAETGWIISAFYVGQSAGAFGATRLIARFGHVPFFAACVVVCALCPLGFTGAPDLVVWSASRFVLGFALASIFVTLESWLSDLTANALRGRVFAAYILTQLVGLLAAQSFVPFLAPHFLWALVAIGCFAALAIVPMAAGGLTRPQRHPFQGADLAVLFRASPVGFVCAAVAGFAWAVSIAMAPVYAERAGLDASGTAAFVAAAVIGGIALQIPIGWLSDVRDRRVVLATMGTGAALAASVATMLTPGSWAMLAAFALFGGLTFPFYTVASAHLNDRIDGPRRVSAAAAMGLVFGLGSIFGPIAASAAMEAAGPPGYFIVLAAVTGAFGLFVLYRLAVGRPSAPEQAV